MIADSLERLGATVGQELLDRFQRSHPEFQHAVIDLLVWMGYGRPERSKRMKEVRSIQRSVFLPLVEPGCRCPAKPARREPVNKHQAKLNITGADRDMDTKKFS